MRAEKACKQELLGLIERPTQWVPGAFPPKIKRPGSKADHPRPPSAEANYQWSYTSAAPCAVHDIRIVK
jgi:hypothetical protein